MAEPWVEALALWFIATATGMIVAMVVVDWWRARR